jgi:hypothetical protein
LGSHRESMKANQHRKVVLLLAASGAVAVAALWVARYFNQQNIVSGAHPLGSSRGWVQSPVTWRPDGRGLTAKWAPNGDQIEIYSGAYSVAPRVQQSTPKHIVSFRFAGHPVLRFNRTGDRVAAFVPSISSVVTMTKLVPRAKQVEWRTGRYHVLNARWFDDKDRLGVLAELGSKVAFLTLDPRTADVVQSVMLQTPNLTNLVHCSSTEIIVSSSSCRSGAVHLTRFDADDRNKSPVTVVITVPYADADEANSTWRIIADKVNNRLVHFTTQQRSPTPSTLLHKLMYGTVATSWSEILVSDWNGRNLRSIGKQYYSGPGTFIESGSFVPGGASITFYYHKKLYVLPLPAE